MKRLVLGILLSSGLLSSYAAEVEIIAHRGASFDAPENTLASVRLGWEQQADAVEIDVMLSKDGKIVLFHDRGLKRLAGREGKLADLTLAEIRKLDVGKWKAGKWTGERVPLLSEALATIPEGKRMFVELKVGPEIVPELKRVVTAANKQPEQVIFISFNYDTCARIKREMPQYQVAHVSRFDPAEGPSIEKLIADAKSGNLDALDLDGNKGIGAREARKIKQAGLGYFVWTINDPKRARELLAAGVDGITTDKPGWLREQLDRAE